MCRTPEIPVHDFVAGRSPDDVDEIDFLVCQFVHRRDDGSEIPLRDPDIAQFSQGVADLQFADIRVQEVHEIQLGDLDFSEVFDGAGKFGNSIRHSDLRVVACKRGRISRWESGPIMPCGKSFGKPSGARESSCFAAGLSTRRSGKNRGGSGVGQRAGGRKQREL